LALLWDANPMTELAVDYFI
jgi:hypothetical protein